MAIPFAIATTEADGEPPIVLARIDSTSRGEDAPAEEVAATAISPAPMSMPRLVKASASFLRPRSSSTFQRRRRNSETSGRFISGQSFQVTQNQWLAIDRGQIVQLIVQNDDRLAQGHLIERGHGAGSAESDSRFIRWIAARLRLRSDSPSGRVKPVCDRRLPANAFGFAGQNEKSGLAGILGILHGGQHAATDAKNHSGMPFDNGCERRLIALAELGEEFPIRQPHRTCGRKHGEQCPFARLSGHEHCPRWSGFQCTPLAPREERSSRGARGVH